MNRIEAIKAEIERLKNWNNNVRNSTRMTVKEEDYNRGKNMAYDEILEYISQLDENNSCAKVIGGLDGNNSCVKVIGGQVFGATDVKQLYDGKVYIISTLFQDTDFGLYPHDKVKMLLIKE